MVGTIFWYTMAVSRTGKNVEMSCTNTSEPNSLVPLAAKVARGSWIVAKPGTTSPAKQAKRVIQQIDAIPDKAAPDWVDTSVTKNAPAMNRPALSDDDMRFITSGPTIGLIASFVMA